MIFQEFPTYRGATEIRIVKTVCPDEHAEFAMQLMKTLSVVACTPDGEDAGGRQKLRLMTPGEVVARAATLADEAFEEFRRRGWILDLPEPKVPVARPPGTSDAE